MLNYKENDRLLEIVAAAYLNNISNFINKRKFKDTIVILTSLVEVVDSSYREMFFNMRIKWLASLRTWSASSGIIILFIIPLFLINISNVLSL